MPSDPNAQDPTDQRQRAHSDGSHRRGGCDAVTADPNRIHLARAGQAMPSVNWVLSPAQPKLHVNQRLWLCKEPRQASALSECVLSRSLSGPTKPTCSNNSLATCPTCVELFQICSLSVVCRCATQAGRTCCNCQCFTTHAMHACHGRLTLRFLWHVRSFLHRERYGAHNVRSRSATWCRSRVQWLRQAPTKPNKPAPRPGNGLLWRVQCGHVHDQCGEPLVRSRGGH